MSSELRVIILHHRTDKLRELGELVRALEIAAAEKGVELLIVSDRAPRTKDVLVLTPGRMDPELVRFLEAFPSKILPPKRVSQKELWGANNSDNARHKAYIRRGRAYVMQARMRRRKR